MNISETYMTVDLRRVSSHFVKAPFGNVFVYLFTPCNEYRISECSKRAIKICRLWLSVVLLNFDFKFSKKVLFIYTPTPPSCLPICCMACQ